MSKTVEKTRLNLWLFAFTVTLLALGSPDDAQAQAATALETQPPRVDVFGGYSYMRASTVFTGARVNLHGATFSGVFYLNKWFGVAGDAGIYHAANIANQFTLTVSSYQAGPRIRLPNKTRLTPYGQFLVGGGHAGGTIYTSSLGFGIAPIGANNSLLFAAGGGADFRLSRRISARMVQAEYLYSEFLNGSAAGHEQNNLRLSAGVVFNFGNI
jgi:hypothetical protein